jgi:hypothetical protein
MEQVRRDQALSKSEFYRRLRDWLASTTDELVGPEGIDGRSSWVYVHDGSDMFLLHADTRRDAVDRYLQMVALYGNDLRWEITESQRGKMTAVVYGPEKLRHKPFYLYAADGAA